MDADTPWQVSEEVRKYYASKYGFEDVDFIPIGSFGSIDPLDQFGRIVLTWNGVTKSMVVNDILWQQGFDGINDVLNAAKTMWETGLWEAWTE